MFGIKKAITLFPHVMRSLFVSSGKIHAEDVRKMFRPQPGVMNMNSMELRIWEFLLSFVDNAEENGKIAICNSIMAMYIITFACAELKAFINFITGLSFPIGTIAVKFVGAADADAVAANTCGRQITLSTRIEDKDIFIVALKAIIPDNSFTML